MSRGGCLAAGSARLGSARPLCPPLGRASAGPSPPEPPRRCPTTGSPGPPASCPLRPLPGPRSPRRAAASAGHRGPRRPPPPPPAHLVLVRPGRQRGREGGTGKPERPGRGPRRPAASAAGATATASRPRPRTAPAPPWPLLRVPLPVDPHAGAALAAPQLGRPWARPGLPRSPWPRCCWHGPHPRLCPQHSVAPLALPGASRTRHTVFDPATSL